MAAIKIDIDESAKAAVELLNAARWSMEDFRSTLSGEFLNSFTTAAWQRVELQRRTRVIIDKIESLTKAIPT